MRRPLWIALLAAAAFAVIVLTRLPASWVFPKSPLFACAAVEGSVWSGACAGLTVQRFDLGDLTWDVAPLRALTGILAAHVELNHGPVSARSDVDLGFGGVTLRNLAADLPLDPARVPRVPPQLRGMVHTELALVRLRHGDLTDLKGRIEAHDLLQRTGRVTPIGSYALTFPGGGAGDPVGTLQDLGGPLAVQGTLRLMHGPAYILQGEVAARADAAPELVKDLQFLGSPDAAGRRAFSLAGSL